MLSVEMKQELFRLAIGILILTAVMVVCFALFGFFDLTVLWGALFGCFAAMLNLVLLALSIERAVSGGSPGRAKLSMGTSYTLRMLVIGAVVILGIKLPVFNYAAVVIPLVFPRLVIMALELGRKKGRTNGRSAD